MLKHVRASDDWHDKNIGQKGFTLIELLVVIIILGILAGIVVLAVNGLQDSGQDRACDTEVRTAESAAAAYFADHDETWPEDSGDLTVESENPDGDTVGPYMDEPADEVVYEFDDAGKVTNADACSDDAP